MHRLKQVVAAHRARNQKHGGQGSGQVPGPQPEGRPADSSSSSTELVASSGPTLIDTSSDVVTDASSAVTETSSTQQVVSNPGQGDNPGENHCGTD